MDFGVGFALSALASLLACRAVMAAGLWDNPTQPRKLHRAPTPTSGGVGIGIGVAAGLIALSFWPLTGWSEGVPPDDLRRLAVAVGAASVFLVVGFFDDALVLPARPKFAAFVLASLAAAWSVGVVTSLPIGGGVTLELGLVVGLAGSALWVFTLVNCVNFMDGANGLSMGSCGVALIALGLTALSAGAPAAAVLAFCGAGAIAGFLVWNFPNGALFAGDSGALFVGGVSAVASLLAIAQGDISPFIPPILFFPLLADTLLTLAWRVKQKRDVLAGHAEHIYQIGMRSGLSHGKVAIAYWIATAHCGAMGFVASLAARGAQNAEGPIAAFGASMPVIAFALCAVVSLMVSAAVRRYAVARGLGET